MTAEALVPGHAPSTAHDVIGMIQAGTDTLYDYDEFCRKARAEHRYETVRKDIFEGGKWVSTKVYCNLTAKAEDGHTVKYTTRHLVPVSGLDAGAFADRIYPVGAAMKAEVEAIKENFVRFVRESFPGALEGRWDA